MTGQRGWKNLSQPFSTQNQIIITMNWTGYLYDKKKLIVRVNGTVQTFRSFYELP